MGTSRRLLRRWNRALAQGGALFAIIAGTSTILGWVFDKPRLTDWPNQGISMFPNAAVAAILIGVALLLLTGNGRFLVPIRILAGVTALFSFLVLVQHATGADLGVDTLFLNRAWGQAAAAAPMRMGVPASTSYLILGIALVLATSSGSARTIATALATVATGIAALSLTGYWFGADQLFGVARLTGIAWQTSMTIATLSIGIIAVIPESGLAATLARRDAGGALFRRLIVPIIVIPLLLGYVRILGQDAGLFDMEFGTALRTLAEITLLFLLLWWTASNISWHDKFAQTAQGQLAAIISSSDDAIVSKSLDGMIQSWNLGAQQTFGYTPEEAIGRHISLIIPPERIDEETTILSRLKRGQRIDHFETVRVRKNGTYVDVSISVSPVRDADGNIVGASKIARDITEVKRAEQRFRAVVEATPECVKIVAPDGTLEFMNHAGTCMIEPDQDNAAVRPNVFDLIAPEHREEWIERHKRVCSGERMSWEFEIVGLQGTRRWMESHSVPLTLPDGRVAQLAVSRDITVRKNFERERESLLNSERAAREEAEQAGRLKDEFLATLSHELRTPLNAILGWSQLLSISSQEVDLKEGIDAIRRNARAQAQLIEDLLDMSRIISGKVRLDVQSTDLAAVIQAAIESISPAAEAKDIRVRTVLDPHAGHVSGDPTRLQQVIWNLLTNATKFTPKGGKVDVFLERVNSHLEITVRDTGIGIAPDHLPVVFERFRQIDSSTSRSHGGLGLGLSIVKQLVELHGGTVRVTSPGENLGTTFIVALPLSPLRPSEDRTHPKALESPTFDGSRVDLTGVKVLVVDDEPDARALIRRVLTQCGAEVCAAESAAQGLIQLRSFRPHVLVSDIGMPGTDGYEFMRSVRALSAHEGGHTPAVALTAFARSEDRMRAMLAGFQVHVAKPIEPQELAVTVHSLSNRRDARAGSI